MPNLSLEEIQQRIASQESELQRSRNELEARRNKIATLTKRKEELQAKLKQIEAEMAAVETGAKQPTTVPPKLSQKKPTPRPSASGQAAQMTLPALIVAIIRDAGGPRTVKQVFEEVGRRGYKSTSRNLYRVVETRTYDLLRQGVLGRPDGQPGFIVAQRGKGNALKAKWSKPGVKGPIKTAPAKSTLSGPRAGTAKTNLKTKASASPAKKPAQKNSSVKQTPLGEVLKQILKKSGEPMTGPELAVHALKAGYKSSSKSFKDLVGVVVSTVAGIEHVRGRGYRLKKAKG